MDQAAAKQQVVERIKQANNILVTVSNNPSVDQLAACIGMTLFLNKLEKHATAVYSGQTPPAIEFLQPDKTLEQNTDSLRDFIISLDKAKADKLRYKVEDKFVRIYITPYRTSISEKDLLFEQGDFNVDVVLALGVRDKAQLDAAITQHGRILHDATVISVNAGQNKTPGIGQINWQEPTASSLCEMLVSISEAFGTGLIDNQMATAFLTGIVAETERFSNTKTSPKVMTMAAQLMAAGANQQLIVSKLEPPAPPEAERPVEPPPGPPAAPPSDTLKVSHDDGKQDGPEVQVKPDEIHIDAEGNIIDPEEKKAGLSAVSPAKPEIHEAEPAITMPDAAPVQPPPAPLPTAEPPTPLKVVTPPPVSAQPPKVLTPPVPAKPAAPQAAAMSFEPLKSEPPAAVPDETPAKQPPLPAEGPPPKPQTKPTLGYPELHNEPAAESAPAPKPHQLLDPANHKPSISPPFTADTEPFWYDPDKSLPMDPLTEVSRPDDALFNRPPAKPAHEPSEQAPIFPDTQEPSVPTFQPPPNDRPAAVHREKVVAVPGVVDNARNAVNAALAGAPFNPAVEGPIKALNAQPLPSAAEKPAPPPVPPPLKLDSGAFIPTSASPIPAKPQPAMAASLPKPL